MSDYTLRPITTADADIEEMADLLRVVFPNAGHFTDEVVRWQYRENPDGEAVGFNAWDGGVLAAHYVTLPFAARVHGTQEKGLLSLNTATHPAHQGKGLFTRLANATYASGAERGYGFVIGVANANSTHGFTKKLGFQLVAPLRAMIGIGNLPFRAGKNDVHYERAWTEETLRWRSAHPGNAYTMKHAGKVDLLLSERRQFGARYVLGAYEDLPKNVAPIETRAVRRKVWIGRDPAMHWSGSLYANIPMRFRPSPLNLIFKDLTGKGRTLNPARVRFQAMDFDIL